MEFDQIARELCTADPAGFIPARDREAAAAEQGGDRDLAAALKKLRKPTTAAWAVNLLAARDPRALDTLLDLGERLRSAQRELRGDDLRSLAGERTRTLRDLTARAAALAEEHGHPLTETTRQQVEQTLTAALSDPEAARQVRSATLAKPLEYSGFGLDELAAAAIRRTAEKAEPPAKKLAELREELRRSDAQLSEAADALEAAEREEREAEERCEELRDEIDALREQLAQRRDELEHAEGEQRELRRSAKAARQRRERAQRDRDAIAERLRSAER
ncbi:hypothetical protein F1721_23445 [Saccharopolyspora hirsuta]|uniref:Uncharacterized protein n=1 Tax=Saccharopolyspora hirsuta TaxID=1837 RepID=A0A5M7BJB5_SACHI|nr:hypothetical protein [Saccharopolyspora hirsuta]KAA5830066.1 hypothetical protein F1721_23445 [Saccharopolyspora hirsuta]